MKFGHLRRDFRQVVTGILLTFNNAFNPIQKYNALRWASAACESEIYTYRARARSYSAVVASHEWDFDNESQEPSEVRFLD